MSLPSGYTRLEYIESTGTQYVNTGVLVSKNIEIKLKFMLTSITNHGIVGYMQSASSGTNRFAVFQYGGAWYFDFGNDSTGRISGGSFSSNTLYDITAGNRYIKNNKTESNIISGSVISNLTNSNSISILCETDCGIGKIYSCQIYDNGTLVRDFIPCKNASGVVGMWDDVNSQFYTNAGTGAFTAGPPIVVLPEHKTLVGGTAYDVKGGKCLVNGTAYSIKKGRTLIGGAGYDITFASPYDPVFSNNTWEQIIAACHNNEVPDTWKVADHKPMTINGEDYQIDIIGKNHDDYSDGSGKAPLTFQLHDCYRDTISMNRSSTNNGGWTSCDMRNTQLPNILSHMPMEVQSGIREVNKLTSAGNGSATINTTADKLFLPSEIEIFGSVSNSKSGEGTQYDYYKAGNSKVKNYDGSVRDWWERSPRSNYSTGFCCVLQSGNAGTGFAANWLGLAFGFCF